MTGFTPWARLCTLFLFLALITAPGKALAEDEEDDEESEDRRVEQPVQTSPSGGDKKRKGQRAKYHVADPKRVDAGIFHVAAAIGGNFYIEPDTQIPPDYFKDFGFQAGVFFDFDYSEMDEDIPLCLRGMAGYKYILKSVHVFAFDAVARRMFRVSEKASFGLGLGGSAAVWYRSITDTSPEEEIIFLPSFIISAGFDFTPFMVNFNWLINRITEDDTRTGLELYFGFRL